MFGFTIDADLPPMSAADSEALLASLTAVLQARGLERDGAAARDRWSLVVRSEASQATDADRQAVQDWAAQHPRIRVRVGDLTDLR